MKKEHALAGMVVCGVALGIGAAWMTGRISLPQKTDPSFVSLSQSSDEPTPESGEPQPTSVAEPSPETATQLPRKPSAGSPLSGSHASIAWTGSFEDAMKKARATGKPIMLGFYTDWCGWCKKLEKDVYTAPAVVEESRNFINVKVNAEKRSDIAQQYGVSGFPTILWIKSDGRIIDRLPGYAEAPEFAQWMRSAASKHIKPAV
ncbi:MAG TPA: thioredoxin fold domain-containing protein [Abditibacteriaceae bacterium]|jgi:thioredoxin-related protein